MVKWEIREHPISLVFILHPSLKLATGWSEFCSQPRSCQFRDPPGWEANYPLLKSSPFLVVRDWLWPSHLPLFSIPFSCFFSQQNFSWVMLCLYFLSSQEPVLVFLLRQLGQGGCWPDVATSKSQCQKPLVLRSHVPWLLSSIWHCWPCPLSWNAFLTWFLGHQSLLFFFLFHWLCLFSLF